jgi:signal transduction histidine kinase
MMLPWFVRSIRFRLAVTYSVVVFGIAALVIAGVNIALSRSLEDQPVTEQTIRRTIVTNVGTITFDQTIRGQMITLEQLVNAKAKEDLRTISMWALIGMFPVSIGAGYVVSGRALRPIGEITEVANEIQSADLSRRIHLVGPDDELTRLADTFDAMLDRLEDGADARRRFIQDMSHELRNPLAVMATNLDLALTDDHADAESLRETAAVVRRTVDRLSRTVDDLLVFAREGVPTRARTPTDLAELAREVLEEYSGPFDEAGVALTQALVPVVLDVDRVAVKRAVGNLVDNALHHADGGGVRVGSGVLGEWAWVAVEDRGSGIAPDAHAAVFQRHWSTVDVDSRGLGLAIVRQVAETHGGLATVRSDSGDGATFVVWLPAGESAEVADVTDDGVHHRRDPFDGRAAGP